MFMLIDLVLLTVGLVLLIKGADWMIDGASSLAARFRVSKMAIGLTIVAFGTSAPELVVNTLASYQAHQDLVFGNVIGSNIINLFAVLGIAGLITPIAVQHSTVWKEIPISFFAIIALYLFGNDFLSSNDVHVVSRLDGFILLVFFISFLFYVYRHLRLAPGEVESHTREMTTWKMVLLIIVGLGGLIGGGHLTVTSAVALATKAGLSEKVIGLTVVALGTSLPELATTIVAAAKKNTDIAVGNIIGSNIFNIFFIVSASALVRPIIFDPTFNGDLYLLAGGTIFLFLAMFMGHRFKLERWQAFILFLGYILYTTYVVYIELNGL